MDDRRRQAVRAFLRSLRDVTVVVTVMGFMLALAILGFWLFFLGSGWWIACATAFVVTFILVAAFARMDMY